ncbi:VTT domain-containing protein [Azospirillum sp. SYSU D00513]|uniref:VTT domain-containing protein n=1 Tax=Azospirillum sp. SYSU D00513 TaxID=2812561 RepID=UPI001A96F31C|nr:VTT domain-containing protein [Azospirillum sp. SYSU D00513]
MSFSPYSPLPNTGPARSGFAGAPPAPGSYAPAGLEPIGHEGVLAPGHNVWRVETAHRLGVVIDAEEYFIHAKAAMRRARRSIYLTAWDLDTRIRLMPQTRRPRRPDRLGTLLNWLATTRPDLTIHVLKWDFAELFDLARWSKPFLLRNWLSHRRLQYRLDGDHPTGACHHQKMLIVDDELAFCGGLDITANRWDTRAHRAEEPLRRQPDGTPYEPFHDLMMAVDGDAARALGELFRERWWRATGVALTPPGLKSLRTRPRHGPRAKLRASVPSDPWPPNLAPLLRDVPVGIARTEPAGNGRAEVREVEALYRDAIASARRFIYLESQYFASTAVADALKARLAEPDGPEVVVVNPLRTTSWLENAVMLGARARLTRELREADRHGRFRLYAAMTDGGTAITVHAKVMVVDDRILRIGSANLNNRSMGLDTECDLALEAPPDTAPDGPGMAAGGKGAGGKGEEVRRAIAAVRDDLLAEHLGTTPERFAAELERRDSLIGAVEALRRPEGRTLEPLDRQEPGAFAEAVAEARVFDPERPVGAVEIVRRILPSSIPRRHPWVALLLLLAAAVGLSAMWRYTEMREWATLGSVLELFAQLRAMPLGPLLLVLLYVAGGLVMFPVMLLVAATAIAFGPALGFATAMCGVLASATVLFWVGRRLGQGLIERWGGRSVKRISARLARSGVVAVAGVRAVPLAPFTVVNLVCGASRIRFTDYIVGTAAGMAPGTLAFSVLGHQLERTLSAPTLEDMALLAGLAAAAMSLGWAAGWLVGKARRQERP